MTEEVNLDKLVVGSPDDVRIVGQKPLEDPGAPIVLVVKVDMDGASSTRYLGDPSWAIGTLRAIADSIEAEVGADEIQDGGQPR